MTADHRVARYGRLLTVVILVVFPAAAVAQNVVYVDDDATGSGDGSSWCDAFVYLQDALAAAAASGGTVNEIRIAQGTYMPDQGAAQTVGDREATFQLLNGVTIAGGYAGCGALDPNERDLAAYETLLSGDLAGDDVEVSVENLLDEPTRAENSYHVVTASGTDETAALDGCTITGGNANQSTGRHFNGGGMYNDGGNATVNDCTMRANSAHFYGGGMFNYVGSSPTVTNCAFSGNLAGSSGGGMLIHRSNPAVTNCTFSGNVAALSGGGMYNNDGAPAVTDCTFTGNSARWVYGGGGAMRNYFGDASVTNCTFTRNTTLGTGGGMYNHNCDATVTNCNFSGNSADGNGGGMRNSVSQPTIINCTFSANSANWGGGMYNNNDGSSPTVTNCLLWSNSPDEIVNDDARTDNPTVSYCAVQGSLPAGTIDGGGNIDVGPLFVDADGPDDTPGTSDDDLHLMLNSPGIDAGDNTSVPDDVDIDLDGNLRFIDDPDTLDTGNPDGINPLVDMGAYEFDPVDGDGKIAICHKGRTIEVSIHSLSGHLRHGDERGACTGTKTRRRAPGSDMSGKGRR